MLGCLILWELPGEASAGTPQGSLSVTDGQGQISVSGRGLIFGQVGRGTLTVLGYKPRLPVAPAISGASMVVSGDGVVYSGDDIRFLFGPGRYAVAFVGTGIDIAAVGRGSVTAHGDEGNPGTFSADGGAVECIGLSASFSFGQAGGASTTDGHSGQGLGRYRHTAALRSC